MNIRKSHVNCKNVCAAILKHAGVDSVVSNCVAENLILAELRGLSSHGLIRLPIYVKRVKKEVINTGANISILKESSSTLHVDGNNNFGAYVGMSALTAGIKIAKKSGVCVVAIRNSNHFGLGAYYARKALSSDCAFIGMSNAPQTMSPIGGVRPFLGTNPVTIAFPTHSETPFILDMATSATARGKIMVAKNKEETIPAGWAVDKNGDITSDPGEALMGSLLPMAGHKGFGIAMAVDIFSGILSGAGAGPSVHSLYENFTEPQNVGHCFIIVDVDNFVGKHEFKTGLDLYLNYLKKEPHRQDVKSLLYAGEIENTKYNDGLINGISVDEKVLEEMQSLAREYNIEFCD